MTRIVAGAAGGRPIRVPARGTRPTSERVREALFSRLEHERRLEGATVLDLYAGSGALGLEAASRGAGRVVLVESAREAVRTCRANVAALGLEAVVEVAASAVEAYLSGAVPGPVDLALLDPPYDLGDDTIARVLEDLVRHLAPGGAVVVERARRGGEPRWPDALEPGRGRAYGDTVLWFATVAG